MWKCSFKAYQVFQITSVTTEMDITGLQWFRYNNFIYTNWNIFFNYKNLCIIFFFVLLTMLWNQEVTTSWKLSMKYPFLRKLIAMAAKYGLELLVKKNASVMQVDLDGNPIALYHDHPFSHITSGVKIGNHLYCGSLLHSYIVRLDLLKYPAQQQKKLWTSSLYKIMKCFHFMSIHCHDHIM